MSGLRGRAASAKWTDWTSESPLLRATPVGQAAAAARYAQWVLNAMTNPRVSCPSVHQSPVGRCRVRNPFPESSPGWRAAARRRDNPRAHETHLHTQLRRVHGHTCAREVSGTHNHENGLVEAFLARSEVQITDIMLGWAPRPPPFVVRPHPWQTPGRGSAKGTR